MILFFIRHGQTDWNLNGLIQGSCDIELNEEGILQADKLSRSILQRKYIFKIFSSPKKRAVQTAKILSTATDVEYVSIEGLEEINLGAWEGLSWDEVKRKYPTEYNEWFLNRRYTNPPPEENHIKICYNEF